MAPSPTSISNHHTTKTYTSYDVTCFNHRVRTIVTTCPNIVTSWVNHIRSFTNPSTTIVGLDTEWLNPVATLQLCVGSNCLIYQLMYTPCIPLALLEFFKDPQWKFSGVGILGDCKMLLHDYDLRLSCVMDVSKVAAEKGVVSSVNAGLKTVAKAVLGWEMEKAKEITMSKWNNKVLDESQVLYACMDAFVSYHIGQKLVGDECGFNDANEHKDFGENEYFV